MNTKKSRAVAWILCLFLMAFTFAACGGGEADAPDEEVAAKEDAFVPSTRAGRTGSENGGL